MENTKKKPQKVMLHIKKKDDKGNATYKLWIQYTTQFL